MADITVSASGSINFPDSSGVSSTSNTNQTAPTTSTTSTQDTSSSGGGRVYTGNNYDPANPGLSYSIDGMTDAQLYASILAAVDKARKNRSVGPPELKVSSYNQSSVHTGQQTTTTKDKDGKDVTTTKTVTTINTNTLETYHVNASVSLADLTLLALQKKMGQLLPPQIGVIVKYINDSGGCGNYVVVPSTVNLLSEVGKTNSVNMDDKAINAAVAVSFSQFIMEQVKKGDIKDLAKKVFPDDPQSADKFEKVFTGIALETNLNHSGEALFLPGLANQVGLQAQAVRDEVGVLSDENKLEGLLHDTAVKNAPGSGLSEQEIQNRLKKAVNNAVNENTSKLLNSQEDVEASLQDNLNSQFSDHPNLVSSLQQDILSNAIKLAIGSKLYKAPSFNADEISESSVQSSIVNALQKEFNESDRAIRAATRAKQIADEVLGDKNKQQFDSEQSVRDAIKAGLLNDSKLQGYYEQSDRELTPEVAGSIAARIDLGLPKVGPLYDQNSTLIIPPDQFKKALQEAYQSTIHADPGSDFGKAIENISGVAQDRYPINVISLINQNYIEDTKGNNKSYLKDLDPGVIQSLQGYTDPGAQLAKEWSKKLNEGGDPQEKGRITLLV